MWQGSSKNHQGPGKNNWTDHVPSGLLDKNFAIFKVFLILNNRKRPMATLCSMEAAVDG